MDPERASLVVVEFCKNGLRHLGDVGQQLGVVHSGQGRLKKMVRLRLILNAPLGEQSPHQWWTGPTDWHP